MATNVVKKKEITHPTNDRFGNTRSFPTEGIGMYRSNFTILIETINTKTKV